MPKTKTFNSKYGDLLRTTTIPEIATSDEADLLRKPLNEIIKQNLPKKLFRYRECNEYSIDAFRRNLIFFNTPNNFNDPHDCLVYFDNNRIDRELEFIKTMPLNTIIKSAYETKTLPPFLNEAFPQEMTNGIFNQPQEYFEKVINDAPNMLDDYIKFIENEIKSACNTVLSHFRNNPKIACFSQNIKQPLMWSYYANSHKGFALEYNFNNYVPKCENCKNKCANFTTYELYPIVYSNRRYDATDFAMSLVSGRIFQMMGVEPTYSKFSSVPDKLALQKANTYKSTCWNHEREWRMQLHCINRDNQRNWLYCKPIAIYFGCHISDINRDILLKYAKDNEVTPFQMDEQLSKAEYKMNYSKIR